MGGGTELVHRGVCLKGATGTEVEEGLSQIVVWGVGYFFLLMGVGRVLLMGVKRSLV